MISALICTHKAGDVLPLALEPLVRSGSVHQILVADGPTPCDHTSAILVDEPRCGDVASDLSKVRYSWSDHHAHRAAKCNALLEEVKEGTTWILVVDSDEIWAVRDLDRLVALAEAGGYGRYRFRTINPFPDFTHGFVIPNEKPRLYRWFPDARCPDRDRLHQYVLSDKQRATPPEEHRWGCAMLSGVTLYHLNALRAIAQGSPRHARRVLDNGDGTVTWRGGKQEFCAHVDELPDEVIPEVIAELGRSTL